MLQRRSTRLVIKGCGALVETAGVPRVPVFEALVIEVVAKFMTRMLKNFPKEVPCLQMAVETLGAEKWSDHHRSIQKAGTRFSHSICS